MKLVIFNMEFAKGYAQLSVTLSLKKLPIFEVAIPERVLTAGTPIGALLAAISHKSCKDARLLKVCGDGKGPRFHVEVGHRRYSAPTRLKALLLALDREECRLPPGVLQPGKTDITREEIEMLTRPTYD